MAGPAMLFPFVAIRGHSWTHSLGWHGHLAREPCRAWRTADERRWTRVDCAL